MRRTAVLAPLLLLAALVLPGAPVLAPVAAYSDTARFELASPSLVVPGAGRLTVFTRGAGGALVRQMRDEQGRWSVAHSLGGVLTSKPAAASTAPGRTDVVARGDSGQLLHRSVVNGVWSPWSHLSGQIVGAPAIASSAPGRLDVVARGPLGGLLHRWHVAGRWSDWQRLGGSLASAPSLVSMAPGRLDVFARGSDAQLHHGWLVAGVWSGWERLGGVLHSEPSSVSTGDGRLDVFARGGDGDVRHKPFVRGTGWGAWARLPGAVSSGTGVVRAADGSLVLGARDLAGRAVTRTRPPGGGWSPWALVDAAKPFRRLGAWVDLYDYELPGASLNPAAALDDLRARGVRTLYLQTSRFSVGFDMAPRVNAWLDGARARGMHVVGWYLAGYGDMPRDLRRTLAIANHRTPAGARFDAVGVDIEAHTGWGTTNEVPRTTMNARAVEHLRAVRARTTAPIAAITPQPTATDGVGETWEGFPWRGVGASSDVVLPMSYWPRTCRDACVREYTATNARWAREWSGRPAHIAGRGYPSADGTQVSDSDIRAFVDGAVSAGVVGGSVYDYASTRARTSWWPLLQRLNGL